MADEKDILAPPPPPPPGEIVAAQQLYAAQISLYRNTLAFGGQSNPSSIWSSMVRNEASALLYYRELEDKDEDVGNALDTLKLSVLERDRTVDAADDSQLALDAAEFVEAQINNLPDFHSILDCILDAPGYGFSVQEMIFDTSEGQVQLADIHDCPQELFLFGSRFYPQIGPMQFLSSPYEASGQEVPEQKFVIFTYRKRSRNRMGRPLLRSVFWPSWFKRNMQRLWLQYGEKGPGTAVVYYNDPDNPAERMQAAAIAQAIIDNVAIAVPQSFKMELELLKVARSQDPAVYEKFFQAMQYSITRKVLGETLTSFGNEGGTGSQAQGKTHADTLEQRSIELCRSMESVINRQIIRPLVLWNFGPDAPMPTWRFEIGEDEDLAKRITVDKTLQSMGYPITKNYVQQTYDIPEADAKDEVLVPTPGPQTVMSAAGTPDNPAKPNFSEAEKEAVQELAEFDKLMNELKADASGIYTERVKSIADSAATNVRARR